MIALAKVIQDAVTTSSGVTRCTVAQVDGFIVSMQHPGLTGGGRLIPIDAFRELMNACLSSLEGDFDMVGMATFEIDIVALSRACRPDDAATV